MKKLYVGMCALLAALDLLGAEVSTRKAEADASSVAAPEMGESADAPAQEASLSDGEEIPEGLEASDWASIRAAHEAWLYSIMPVEGGGGHRANNKSQQWTTSFDGGGFTVRPNAARWRWGLELKSYGFAGGERAVSRALEAKVEGTTLENEAAQPLGGGMNSSLSVGTITMGSQLGPGASVDVQFLFNVQQSGSFRVFVFVEALP